MRKAWMSPLVVLLVLSLSACGAAKNSDSTNSPQRVPTTVEVTNHNWSDVVVYMVRNSSRVRLGLVTSMNTSSFRVPPVLLGTGASLQLEARPIGARDQFRSPSLQVLPGQKIELTVQNHMSISSVAIR
jgi:hypothetical protein